MQTFPTVDQTRDDAAGFVSAVNRVIAGHVFRYRPELVCVMRIRRWFDHRWMEFSGKGRVNFNLGGSTHIGVALDEHRQDQLTFPPFVPTRVAAEEHWERASSGDYERTAGRFEIHRFERQHSSANLQRRIADLAPSALYVWFSSTSAVDRRASVLVYIVSEGTTIPWFASLRSSTDAWTLGDVKGLGRVEVQELLDHPPGVR